MVDRIQFYVNGRWVDPVVKDSTPVVNRATEESMYEGALGFRADIDKAAAKRALETFSQTSREQRVALLSRIIKVYKTGMRDIGAAVADEMSAAAMAEKLQAGAGLGHTVNTLDVQDYHFEEPLCSAIMERARRRLRRDHVVEAEPDRPQNRATGSGYGL
jgi:aldehyde dehydrogenase (NAD+)